MRHRHHQGIRRAMLCAAALALSGCAAFKPATPEQAVQERAAAFWQARLQGDYTKAYSLLAPGYRKLRTVEQFKTQFGAKVGLRSAEVHKVTCEAEKCVVRVKMGARPALPGLSLGIIETYADETWLLEDGQWWRYQET